MKKPIPKLAILAMALLSSIGASAYDFDDGVLGYTMLSGTNNVSVGIKSTQYSGAITIPATVTNGGVTYAVTEVANLGFNNCNNITSVTIEGNNLEKIGCSAFKSTTGITGDITIPASVKVIDYEAFSYSYASSFTFAEGSQLERLGAENGDGDVFWGTYITQVPNLPNTITSFGDDIFKNCSYLTNSTLPACITEIPKGTFMNCVAMETISIGSTVTKIGESAFEGCKLASSVTIPATVTEIGTNAFYGCSGVTTLTFEARTAPLKIGTRAFSNCSNLTSVSLPDQVNEMGDYVFQYCDNLATAHFSTGMTKVPSHTFDCCYAMGSVDGLDNVTRLEMAAFGNCRGFTSFTIPANVEYIGTYALGDLHNCESYTFAGNKVTEIANLAFQHNKKLASFTMPNTVLTLGPSVFYDSPQLSQVTLNNQLTAIPDATFNGAGLTSFEIPSNITQIGAQAFLNCGSLESVTIPSTVTRIGNEAFRGSKLASVVIPSGATIGTGLFVDCKALASVTLLEGITEIPDYTFQRSGLSGKFTIPATVTRIGTDAFQGCNNITEVEFAEGSVCQTIDYEAFYMDSSTPQLERFIMPNTVTTLGRGAFRGCKKLDWDNFHLSTQVTTLLGWTFYNAGFTHFDLSKTSVTTLADNEFAYNDFVEFHLPAGVTLGSSDFYGCSKLERFYFEDGSNITNIPANLFNSCPNLNYVYLPVATPPTLSYSFDDPKMVLMDVPTSAIETYKANSDWQNFRYLFTLEDNATSDLSIDDAAAYNWSFYEENGMKYAKSGYGNNNLAWTFVNTAEKEYYLLFDAATYFYNYDNNYIEVTVNKLNDDGTITSVQTLTEKITAFKLYSSTPDLAYMQQVLMPMEGALAPGKYQVSLKQTGSNDKFVANAMMIPSDKICFIEPMTLPAGAGALTITGKTIQAVDKATSITITAPVPEGKSWISFRDWTIGSEVVSTDAAYTFTPEASAKVVANYTVVPQNIPADLDNFDVLQAVLYPANPDNNQNSMSWWERSNQNSAQYEYIRSGNSATYFVKSTKPALYNLKFRTSNQSGYSSAYTVDVFDAQGKVIFTEQKDIEQTAGWYNDDMKQETVAITAPLMPGEEYSVRITFSSEYTDREIANFNRVEFEVAAIVPDIITLDKTEATVKVDFNETLVATLGTTTNDPVGEDYAGIVWASSDEAVATVDAAGKVTAVAPGEAVITAKAAGRADIELVAECAVTVPQHVTDITVPAAQEMYVGNEVTITAVAAPENAADKSLAWASSDEDVVTVDAAGKLTAVAPGQANITVTAADRNKLSKTIAVTVHQPVTAITLDKAAADMLVGKTLTLAATVAPTDPAPYNSNLEWTSSDDAVATVAVVDGVVTVTAVGKGTASIIATAADGQGATAQCDVTVTIPVAAITLPATEKLFTGKTLTLTAEVAPANADNKVLTWTTSNEDVATVDGGVVTGVAAGTAVITATAADGSGVTASTTVTVTVAVTEITLNGDASKTMHKGETFTMTATTNADASDKTVTWSSDNEAVATVSAAGVVTAVAGGVANITATANDGSEVSATCAVTVDVPVTSVTLNETSATLYKDQTIQLVATVNPEDATISTVSWTSSAPAIASVSDNGLVTALAPGDAIITATSDADASKYDSFSLHVLSVSAVGTGANQLLFHDAVNSSAYGDNCVAWDDASSKNWVANSIVLTDGSSFTCPYTVEAAQLTYNRTFASDNWAPLYVPFDMSYDEWKNDAAVAELAGVHMYDDGRPTVVEFISVKSGDIKPNMPYVIKPNAAGALSIVCSEKTVAATPAEGSKYISCGTPRWTYKFFGNYQPMTAAQVEAVDASSPYIMTTAGKFAHIDSDATLLPFRFYIVKAQSENGYWGAPAMDGMAADEILLMVDGAIVGDASGMFEVIVEGEDGIYYDLSGRPVQTPRSGNIYIHNGQKVLVK